MKKEFLAASFAALFCIGVSGEVKVYNGHKLKQMTPEEERAWRERRASNVAIQRFPDSAKIAVVNCAKGLEAGVLDRCAAEIASRIGIDVPVEVRTGPIDPAAIAGDIAQRGVRGAVYVVEMPGWPISLVAPEGGWAMLNAAALAADHPGKNVFSKRLTRGMWRAFAFTFGAGDAMFDGCVTKPVSSLAELDALPGDGISPGLDDRIIKHLKGIGVKPARRTTYKRACQEGWAPAPTNAYQKAIWEQVKADKERGPTNPITIPPPKK